MTHVLFFKRSMFVVISGGTRKAVVTKDGTVYLAHASTLAPGDSRRLPALVVVSAAKQDQSR